MLSIIFQLLQLVGSAAIIVFLVFVLVDIACCKHLTLKSFGSRVVVVVILFLLLLRT